MILYRFLNLASRIFFDKQILRLSRGDDVVDAADLVIQKIRNPPLV